MRRNDNYKNLGEKNINDKIISYIVVGVIIVAIIIISLLLYSQKVNKDVKDETMSLDQMTNIIGDTDEYEEETESASTDIGKTVEESEEEEEETNGDDIMSMDVQKELEAKFDELFGSFDDDNN